MNRMKVVIVPATYFDKTLLETYKILNQKNFTCKYNL